MDFIKSYLLACILLVSQLSNAQTEDSRQIVSCWKQVATGSNHFAAIKNDGTLWTWGVNSYGQLGNGINTSTSNSIPVQVGTLNTWKQVSATSLQTFAIQNDGTLWACGYNGYGQLGNGTTVNSLVPIQVGTSSDWKEVYNNNFYTLAIKNDGTLWGWGYNGYGILGNGTIIDSHVPIQIGTSTNWKQASAGIYHCCAVQHDGTLWAWGYGGGGQLGNGANMSSRVPVQVGNLNTWRQASAGQTVTTAIKNNGTLWVWGTNSYGLFGNGTTLNYVNTPLQIGTASNWLQVASGSSDTFAIKTNGTLWAWGSNFSGELGIGNNTNAYTPTQCGTATSWKQVSPYEFTSGAVQDDGTLWSWGENSLGQLGNGTFTDTNVPTDIGCPAALHNDDFYASKSLILYPNPVKDVLYIKKGSDTSIEKIIISDFINTKLILTHPEVNEVDVSSLSSGLYLVKIYSDATWHSYKVMKL